MRGIGLLLLIIGASEFAFRYLRIDIEHLVFTFFGEHRTAAAIAFVAVGATLTLLSFRRKKKDRK